MEKTTTPVSIRLADTQLDEARHIADRQGLTTAQVLRDALEIGLGAIEARPDMLRQAGRKVAQEAAQ